MPSEQRAGLSREFIERQRQRLIALRDQLLGGEEDNLARKRMFRLEHGDEALEEEEMAQDMAQREVDQGLHDVDNRRLANIERALQKIAEGSYGLSFCLPRPSSRPANVPASSASASASRSPTRNPQLDIDGTTRSHLSTIWRHRSIRQHATVDY